MTEFKYRVVSDISSLEDPELTIAGDHILFQTNNFQTARRECIEWADYDDILVRVTTRWGGERFRCDGALEAHERYQKTVDKIGT